jgi:hypothetical protein
MEMLRSNGLITRPTSSVAADRKHLNNRPTINLIPGIGILGVDEASICEGWSQGIPTHVKAETTARPL